MQKQPIKAILFDLDGTLADTIRDIGGAVNRVLRAHGFAEHPVEAYKIMVGNGFAMLMKRALPPKVAEDEKLFAALTEEASDEYSRNAFATTEPFPGMRALLGELEKRGISIAVLSNKPDGLTRLIIEAIFPDAKFMEVRGDKPGRPRKPDPTAALEIADLSGIPPGQWAFVGDSGVDMETARASGMLPIGVSWGYRSRDELTGHGAFAIIDKPLDLVLHI